MKQGKEATLYCSPVFWSLPGLGGLLWQNDVKVQGKCSNNKTTNRRYVVFERALVNL